MNYSRQARSLKDIKRIIGKENRPNYSLTLIVFFLPKTLREPCRKPSRAPVILLSMKLYNIKKKIILRHKITGNEIIIWPDTDYVDFMDERYEIINNISELDLLFSKVQNKN
jgi:hypothetical protein